MITLRKNERLVYAGKTALRAPDGTPLPAVPQFIIVSADKTDPTRVTPLGKNERLILAGHMLNERKRAEERFAALKAGRKPPRQDIGAPLYIVEDKEKTTANTEEQNSINADLAKYITTLFSLHMRKVGAEEQQKG